MMLPPSTTSAISRFISGRAFEEDANPTLLRTEFVVAYLSSQYDDAGIQELLRSGANTLQSLLQESISKAPVEHQAALAAIADNIGQGIKPSEMKKRRND